MQFNIIPRLSKPATCRGCILEHDGLGFSEPEGTGALGVLCVAESLGDHEVKDGLPLRPNAPAGSVFERALRKCGLSRAQVAVWNLTACQPPYNDLRGYESAIQHCRVHFKQVLNRYKPRVILALGSLPLASLTGYAGEKQTVEYVRGYVLPSLEWPDDIHVVSTYHPSYIVRGAWNVFGAFCRDIKYAVDIAKHGWHPKPVEYVEHGGAYEFNYIVRECKSEPQLAMSIDFETEGNIGAFEDEQLETALRELYEEKRASKKIAKKYKLGTDQAITSLNVSIHERQSFVFDWTVDNVDSCSGLLLLPNPKVGHNVFSFDLEVARFNRVGINGVADDTMLMFHHLYPDLPGRRGKIGESETDGSFANLQYCASFAQFDQPWKHLVKDQPGFYGCLEGNSLVQTVDGYKKIKDLVRDRYDGLVYGVDEFGCIAKGRVYGWIRNQHDAPVKWLSVETKHSYKGKDGYMVTRYTPDHKLMTPNGWREIQNLKPGDKLLLPQTELSAQQRQVVIGSILGDGSLQKRNPSGWACLRISHCEQQLPYLNWKRGLLGALVTNHEFSTIPSGPVTICGKKAARTEQHSFTTVNHPVLADLYARVYTVSSSHKTLSDWMFELYHLGLAIAYQDNGTLVNKRYPRLYLPFRTKEECLKFKGFLTERYGFKSSLIEPSNGNYFALGFLAESCSNFFSVIARYVHPSMLYKLPEEFRNVQFNGKPYGNDRSKACDPLFITDVIRVFENPVSKGRTGGIKTSYCLDVHGIHSFLTPYEVAHNCCDSDATLRLFNMLKVQMAQLRYGTSGPTIWDSYVKLVADLWPLLRDASRRGIPINQTKILAFLDSVVRRQRLVGERIQSVIPVDLLPAHSKKGYAKTPKNTIGMVLRDFPFDSESKRCKCFRVRKTDIEMWAASEYAEYSAKDGRLRAPNPSCKLCKGYGWICLPDRVETRWCKLDRFNPNSPVQMKAYAAYHHHKIPKNKDRKIAMDKWTLDQLAKRTRDPLYRSTIEYRQFEKMSSYAIQWNPKPADLDRGWEYPAAHPEFSFFPATGQLSSFNPNCQNLPSLSKYGPLAHEFRDAIEAPPGYVIVEADMRSFHAQTLGFEANCTAYIRLAKLDVHSYIAGNMLKLPYFDQCIDWEDAELLEFLKWHRKNYVCPDGTTFQKVRDERAKVGILAFGLGQGASSLFEANRDSFLPKWFREASERYQGVSDRDVRRADREGIRSAQLVHDALNDRFPELKRYRDTTPLIARQNGDRLISRYGCIRWFFDIQHWDSRRREMVHGDDWDKAIAFPVQNSAHGYLKYALLRMNAPLAHDERGMLERYGFINTVHDSVVFCCRKDLLDEALPNIKRELERPSDVLTFADGSGLSIGCEAKAGATWGDMNEVQVKL